VATVSAFFMAQGLSDAYTSDGEWFSVPFALTMTVGLGLYWWGLRGEPDHQRALATYLPVAAVGVLAAGVSGFLPDTAQEWGYGATVVTFLAAGIASAFGTPFHIYPKHFAERHGLIVIVAMGESVIAVGIGSADLDRSAEFAFAVGLGAAAVCVLWWTYFDWLQEALEHALRRVQADFRTAVARDVYTFAHLLIVLGIVFVAVATEEVIAHPSEPLADYARFALAAGDAIFFAGTVIAYFRSNRVLLLERTAAAALIPLIVLMLPEADAVVIAALTTTVKVGALVVEWFRAHPERAAPSTA
jgi:low temperature requirement protein LtrA